MKSKISLVEEAMENKGLSRKTRRLNAKLAIKRAKLIKQGKVEEAKKIFLIAKETHVQ